MGVDLISLVMEVPLPIDFKLLGEEQSSVVVRCQWWVVLPWLGSEAVCPQTGSVWCCCFFGDGAKLNCTQQNWQRNRHLDCYRLAKNWVFFPGSLITRKYFQVVCVWLDFYPQVLILFVAIYLVKYSSIVHILLLFGIKVSKGSIFLKITAARFGALLCWGVTVKNGGRRD